MTTLEMPDRLTAVEARKERQFFTAGISAMQFSLPVQPVPLSACFVNVAKNGRAESPRYKAFKRIVDADLAKNLKSSLGTPYKATFTEDVIVTYTVRRPDRRTRDLDNLCKALNDTLTRNHILKDDSQIVDLRIKWAGPTFLFDGEVFVAIAEAA